MKKVIRHGVVPAGNYRASPLRIEGTSMTLTSEIEIFFEIADGVHRGKEVSGLFYLSLVYRNFYYASGALREVIGKLLLQEVDQPFREIYRIRVERTRYGRGSHVVDVVRNSEQ